MTPGIIEHRGTPRAIYENPKSLFVADFIGSTPMNFLNFRGHLAKGVEKGHLDGGEIREPTVHTNHGEDEFILGVLPEQVQLTDAGPLRGVVFGVEYLGTTQIVTVTTP